MTDIIAEIRLPTAELRDDIPFFTKTLKMRLDSIYPADDPQVAVFSGHGLRVRVENGATEPPGTIRILTDDPDAFAEGQRVLTAPNGTRLKRDHTESWVDPMIGVRIYAQGASPFYMTAWGMIGGFGAASDIDGDVLAGVGYQVTDWASVYAGYRAYGVRYADQGYSYDAIQHGPVIAGVFRF